MHPRPAAGFLFRCPFIRVGRGIKASAVRKFRFHGRHILQASDAKYHFVPAQVQFTKASMTATPLRSVLNLDSRGKPWTSIVFWGNHYGPVAREQFLDHEFPFILVVFNK